MIITMVTGVVKVLQGAELWNFKGRKEGLGSLFAGEVCLEIAVSADAAAPLAQLASH